MSLILYHSVESTCAQKVRLVLAEKSIEWTETLLNLRKGQQFSPEYLQLNPKAVVPTLVHNAHVIRESSVINEYLDHAFPQPSLKPSDPYDRSRMRLLVKTFDDEVHPAVGILTYAMVLRHQMNASKTAEELEAHFERVVDPRRRERQRGTHELGLRTPPAKQAVAALDDVVAALDRALELGPWLAGECYSLADACAAPYVVRMQVLTLDRLWKGRPRISDWLHRVCARDNCLALQNVWGPPGFAEMVAGFVQREAGELQLLMDQR